MDKRNPSGFTIIEVILFFAVSSALMLGIISGVSRSIARQRYNDTVNDFAEYIRGVYSDVQAVANGELTTTDGGSAGRTNKAIYGKLLEFSDGGKQITSYTISGLALSQNFIKFSMLGDGNGSCHERLSTLELLGCAKSDIISGDSNQSTYRVIWDGKIEKTTANNPFGGCILVVRSPISGIVQTFYSDSATCATEIQPSDLTRQDQYFLTYNAADINFCVQSDDNPNDNNRRRNIRILKDASNSSGVIVPELDGDDNAC